MKRPFISRLQPFANAYLLLSIGYYWMETGVLFNPLAIALLVIIGLHLFVAKGLWKHLFPSLFILINLFMFLALFSEFSEFESLTSDALILLSVGTLYLGLNIVSAVVILVNYSTSKSSLSSNYDIGF